MSIRIDSPEYRKDYNRGWRSSSTTQGGALDAADYRGEPTPWYDGYYDNATNRPKWHRLHCTTHNTTCPLA